MNTEFNNFALTDFKRRQCYYNKFLRGGDGVVEKNTPFILLANQEQSKFYCPSTEYRDSLLSTPSGRAKER